MLSALQKEVATLRGGDWLGPGASSFYAEMDTSVIPSLKRLVSSLDLAAKSTQRINLIFQQAEHEAAAVLRMLGAGGGPLAAMGAAAAAGAVAGGGAGRGAAAGGGAKDAFSPLTWALGKSAGLAFKAFQESGALKSAFTAVKAGGGYVRFAKDAYGNIRVLGSAQAKNALGVTKSVLKPGMAKEIGKGFGWSGIKLAVKGEGAFGDKARAVLAALKKSPVEAALPKMDRFKAGMKVGGGIATAVAVGQNLYKYWDGGNFYKNPQFYKSTAIDVGAGVGIVAVSTAIGSFIPIPGVGTAVGFVVGTGLSYVYEKWGREAITSAVDATGKFFADAAPKVGKAFVSVGTDIARGAAVAANQVGKATMAAVNTVGSAAKSVGSAIGSVASKLKFW